MKKWCCLRRYHCLTAVFLLICIVYYLSTMEFYAKQLSLDLTRRSEDEILGLKLLSFNGNGTGSQDEMLDWELLSYFGNNYQNNINVTRESIVAHLEHSLKENLKLEKGSGCNIPQLDPFAKEIMSAMRKVNKIKCRGRDWVKCHLSSCRVIPVVLQEYTDIQCYYRDLIHVSESHYNFSSFTEVTGADEYVLSRSDHASVNCSGWSRQGRKNEHWHGLVVGLRPVVPPKPPKGRKNDISVLIITFDSTSRNHYIRSMPKSLEFMTRIMNMTLLKGYNVVGDGTPAALFPILTGKTELELPDFRKSTTKVLKIDDTIFMFHRMKQLGYHTAYFEDLPWVGTFQYRFNGFKNTPADHYMRSFFMEDGKYQTKCPMDVFYNDNYCVGDTPRFNLMMNVTDQFLQLPGNKYGFTFIADITHDANLISNADEDMVKLLEKFIQDGRINDTLLIVMGDHGSRFSEIRQTIQGKLEERLPMMAIYLPRKLVNRRPDALRHLQGNTNVLTTPHDIYATVLDVLDLRDQWNPYKIEGADFTRGLTLLEPIPANRSCSEAGIEPHWCACLTWDPVSPSDPMYQRAAHALVDYINALTEPFRAQCAPRKLISIHWVSMHKPAKGVLTFERAIDPDGYVGIFSKSFTPDTVSYQIKISVSPGVGVYEASLRYVISTKEFVVSSRDISRTNAYSNEPSCISDTFPFLNMYCYCNK